MADKKVNDTEQSPAGNPQPDLRVALIEQFKIMPIVMVACERVRVPRPTFYRWLKRNKKFKKAVEKAIEEGKEYFNDLNEARMAALMQDKNWNVIRYHLEHHHPDYIKKRKDDDKEDAGPSVIILHEHEDTK